MLKFLKKGKKKPKKQVKIQITNSSAREDGKHVFRNKESIEGVVQLIIRKKKSKVDQYVTVVFLGELQVEKKKMTFISLRKEFSVDELEKYKDRSSTYSVPFSFKIDPQSHNSLSGRNCQVNYSLEMNFLKIRCKKDIIIENDQLLEESKKRLPKRIGKREISVRKLFDYVIKYNQKAYNIKNDSLSGEITLLRKDKAIKSMEVNLIRKEIVVYDKKNRFYKRKMFRHEIVDGDLGINEAVKFRIFLRAVDSITTNTCEIENQFKVKYYIQVFVVCADSKKYYKNIPVEFYLDSSEGNKEGGKEENEEDGEESDEEEEEEEGEEEEEEGEEKSTTKEEEEGEKKEDNVKQVVVEVPSPNIPRKENEVKKESVPLVKKAEVETEKTPSKKVPPPKRKLPKPKRELPKPKKEIPKPKRELPKPKRELPKPKKALPKPTRKLPKPKRSLPTLPQKKVTKKVEPVKKVEEEKKKSEEKVRVKETKKNEEEEPKKVSLPPRPKKGTRPKIVQKKVKVTQQPKVEIEKAEEEVKLVVEESVKEKVIEKVKVEEIKKETVVVDTSSNHPFFQENEPFVDTTTTTNHPFFEEDEKKKETSSSVHPFFQEEEKKSVSVEGGGLLDELNPAMFFGMNNDEEEERKKNEEDSVKNRNSMFGFGLENSSKQYDFEGEEQEEEDDSDGEEVEDDPSTFFSKVSALEDEIENKPVPEYVYSGGGVSYEPKSTLNSGGGGGGVDDDFERAMRSMGLE